MKRLDAEAIRRARRLHRKAISAATDERAARLDQATDLLTGRHSFKENRTYMAWDLPADSPLGETLNDVNQNFFADDTREFKDERNHNDRRQDAQTWGRRIGLTDHEIDRACYLLDQPDDFEHGSIGSEAFVLAALTLAANESPDGPSAQAKTLRGSVPHADETPELSDAYETIRTDLDVPRSTIRDAREHLRQFI
jgi:hypothetical protein